MTIDKFREKMESRRKENAERFQKHFPDTDDLLAIVLRGHLLIEGFVDNLNRHCFHYPEFYDKANLSFSKKILIARAQVLVPVKDTDAFFKAIEKLNSIRNSLAHNLEAPNLNAKVSNFIDTVESAHSKETGEAFKDSKGSVEKRLKGAIAFLLGQLGIMDLVVEYMESTREYGARDSEQVKA